ncbi:MAG: hypothetical protein FWE61_00520 [Micrococcales bacterium]|nr:hypothetical protein [Micrococcales bacterium]
MPDHHRRAWLRPAGHLRTVRHRRAHAQPRRRAGQHRQLADLAWSYSTDHGVLMAPGREQRRTSSVQHMGADADVRVEVVAEPVADLTG